MDHDTAHPAPRARYPETPGRPDADDHATGFGSELMSFATLRGILWRQRHVLAGVVAVALMLALLASLLATPRYVATAMVRVDPDMGTLLEGQDLGVTVGSGEVFRYLETLATVVKSRSLAYRVVDSLGLAANPAVVGEEALANRPERLGARQWRARLRDLAAAALQAKVDAVVPIDQRIITISFESEDPALAARIANSYVENFVTDDVRRALEANSYARTYLEGQIEQVRVKLQDTELRANAYARTNRIITEEQATSYDSGNEIGAGKTITVSNLASINEAFTKARANRIDAEQRWRAAMRRGSGQLRDVQGDQVIQELSQERGKLLAQLAELRQRYGDDHPEVREKEAQVATLGAQIGAIGSDIKAALRNEYEVALQQEQALARERVELADSTLDEQDRRVHLGILGRDADGLRKQLEALLERYNQILSASNIKSSTITKLDSALVPEVPVFPNLRTNLLIALLLGSGLAVGLALVREVLDDRVRSPGDVDRKLGLTLLGSTPLVDIDAKGPGQALDEAYASIRTSVDFALPQHDRNVILVTSGLPGEGKTLSTITLARRWAQAGHKVLLIEADLRKPSISSAFDLSRPAKGFVEVLLDQCDLESALLPLAITNLDVLPVGPIPQNPVDILASARMAQFVRKQSETYSMIIIDSPPIMGIADAPILSRLVDGVVVIIESNRAHFGQTKGAIRRLRDAHANILGVVLTKVHSLNVGESYSQQYSYYRYGDDAS